MTDYPFTDVQQERKKRKAELSDFRRNSSSTLNYVSSTMETGIKSLKKQGMSDEEIDSFVEQVKEKAKKEVQDGEVGSEMKIHLKKLVEIHQSRKESDIEKERQLAQKCLETVEWYLRSKELKTEELIAEIEGSQVEDNE